MRRPASRRRDSGQRPAFAALLLALLAAAGARADNATIPDTPEQLGLRGGVGVGLQLQVFINGRDSKQIVAFERDAAGPQLLRRPEPGQPGACHHDTSALAHDGKVTAGPERAEVRSSGPDGRLS